MIQRIAIGLTLITLMVISFVFWLISTESGLQWGYRQAQSHLPATLSVSGMSGRLIGPLTVEEIRYDHQGSEVIARQISLDWNPRELWQSRIDVSNIDIQSLDITLPESADGNQSTPSLPHVELPLGVQLTRTSINQINFSRGTQHYKIDKIEASARLLSNGLEIDTFNIDSEKLDLSLQGSLLPQSKYAHDLEIKWRTTLPNGKAIHGRGAITGDTTSTNIAQNIDGALKLKLTVELRDLLAKPHWQSELVAKAFDTSQIDSRLPPLKGDIRLSAAGDTKAARISGQLKVSSSEIGAFDSQFELSSLEHERRFEGIGVDSLSVRAMQGNFSARGQLDWTPILRWNADVTASDVNPARVWPEWPGNIEAAFKTSGKIIQGELNASADISQLKGTLRDYPVTMQGRLGWQNNALSISRLNFSSGNSHLSATGHISEKLNLEWSLQSDDLAELYPQAKGSLKASGIIEGHRQSPDFKVSMKGRSLELHDYKLDEVSLVAEADRIDINAVAEDATAEISLKGGVENNHWRGQLLRADIQTRDYKAWKIKAPANIDFSRDSLDLDRVCLHNEAESEICSSVAGANQLWKIALQVNQLPVALFDRWMPSSLTIQGQANADANLEFLSGEHLLGEASLTLPRGTVSYQLTDEITQAFEYSSARLDLVLQNNGINANTTIKLINGDRFDGRADLPGANILALDLKQQRLTATARLNASDLSPIDNIIKVVDGLRGELDLELAVSGTLAKPRLTGNARLNDGSLKIPAANLMLTRLEIDANSTGQQGINYLAEAKSAGGSITLRGDTRLDAVEGWPSRFQLEARSFDIAALLKPWLPANTKIDGALNTTASLNFKAPHNLFGEIQFTAPSGTLEYPLLEGEIEQFQYRDSKLSLLLDRQGIHGYSEILIGDGNRFNGSFDLPDGRLLALDPQNQKLSADAKLDFKELAIIEALVPDITRLQGALALNLDAGGTLQKPDLAISAEMQNASVDIPRLGLNIKQINLRGVTDNDNQFIFELTAKSGEGNVTVNGSSQLSAERGWLTTFAITGDNLEVSRIPEATVNVSPDLVIELQRRTINIRGDLTVPYAKLQPKDITTAAQVSNDAVIVDSQETAQPKWQINSEINLILGERVTFFGFGFEGQLGGSLLIEEKAGQLTRGTGEIKILQGRYRAYGQRLDIENGRLLFTSGPLTDPGLDIRAVRKTGNVTAGIQVNGRLKEPQLELFSIPAMGQTDSLSYLLLGRPMESASGEDGAMMAKAALALGLAGGDKLARSIGDRFGLDEMRIESDDKGDQASLVMGRYLSPKLYVSYGVGLIGSFNTFNFRYRISDRWQLKARSGESHAADLLYTFER